MMTREEAVKAMSEGKKVRHIHFEPGEWITRNVNGLYMFNDGITISPAGFLIIFMHHDWEKGWELV